MEALTTDDLEKGISEGDIIIDTRDISEFKQGFIRGSIALSTIEKFKEYASAFTGFDLNKANVSVLLVLDESDKDRWLEAIRKFGINIKGYLSGGFKSWQKAGLPVDMIIDVEADELMMDIPFDNNLIVVDIRPPIAFGSGHLKDAVNIPLDEINNPLRLSAIEENDNLYLVGNNDEEAFLAASFLKRHDIHNLRVVLGGWPAVQQDKKAQIVKEPGMLN